MGHWPPHLHPCIPGYLCWTSSPGRCSSLAHLLSPASILLLYPRRALAPGLCVSLSFSLSVCLYVCLSDCLSPFLPLYLSPFIPSRSTALRWTDSRHPHLLDRLTGSTYPSGSWTGKQTSHRRDAWEDTLRLIGEDRRRRDRRHWAGSYVAAKAEAPRDLLFFVQGYMRSRTSLGTGRSMISHCVTDQLIIGRYGVVKQDGGESSLCTDIWTPIGPAPLRCYH
ncbi:uncharacterized protein LOC117226908 isoform X2 [Megalopta genalis]|uniref:uncharacterized protein LOC117226908 isoform X2 n=1 Tax=Megalopta genalis TaxID=115081 RepID=UPI003FD43D58